MPVVLCGCETWSLTLSDERRLRVFENRVLRRVFGRKRDEVTGEWRKLHKEELSDLYSLPKGKGKGKGRLWVLQHCCHEAYCTLTRMSSFIHLDFTTRTILGKEYRSLSPSLCNFLHSPVTSSLLGPNTLLNTLFSNTLSLRSSLNVSDQVSHPYRTTAFAGI